MLPSVSTFLGPAVSGSRVTCYYVSGGLAIEGGRGHENKKKEDPERKERAGRGAAPPQAAAATTP